MINRKLYLLAFVLFAALFASCDEKESELGVNLQDPSTLYSGISDTAYGVAYTVFDDSLLTAGHNFALIGCYSDPVFGNAEGVYFTQIVPDNGTGVGFDQNCTIDSVVLSFAVTELYPAAEGSKSYRDLHFEIYQLAESPMKDTAYYASDELPVTGVCFFDDVVRVNETDSMVIKIKLRQSFVSLLSNHNYTTADDFLAAVKGMRVRVVNDGTPVMAAVNLSAAATNITVFYTYDNEGEAIARTYNFSISTAVPHFTHFTSYYAGALSVFNTNTADSVEGSRYLYLSPMGGTNIKVNFDAFVRQFHQQHPFAVVHYAELLLPVADIAPDARPDVIAALKCYLDGEVSNIPDMYDTYTYSGYDGSYDAERGCYRLRVTQHMQKLVKSGSDLGTLLVINARRSSPNHTVINGYDRTATSGNPIRIHFVYSE